jgi:hypothetical protein
LAAAFFGQPWGCGGFDISRCATSAARRSASFSGTSSAMSDPLPATVKPPFGGARLKIQRAKKHLAELEGEIERFIRSGPAKFNVNIPNEGTQTPQGMLVWIKIDFHMDGTPEEVGPIVGDIIHNLRSSLDMMASELVRTNNLSDKNVYFPFCERPEELDKAIKEKNFNRAGAAAVELLKTYQPHRGGNAALRALHDFDVRDKHQSLILSALTAATPAIRVRDDAGNSIWPEIVGAPDAAASVRVIFPKDGPLGGQEVIPTLHELVEMIAGIIEAFAALLSHSESGGR